MVAKVLYIENESRKMISEIGVSEQKENAGGKLSKPWNKRRKVIRGFNPSLHIKMAHWVPAK